MNIALILILFIIIVVMIYLASSFLSLDYLIQNSAPLNPIKTITAASLDAPASSRYYYEGWFYINTNIPPSQENILFNRGNEFVVTLKGSTLNVYAPITTGGKVDTASGRFIPNGDASDNRLVSIPNFPYQKWAQLVINVDGQQVDAYIDGQFVTSKTSSSPIGSTSTNPITCGNIYMNGKVARFRRPGANINPQGVWASYVRGSGQSSSASDYHLNMQLTKNNNTRVDKRLF